MRMSVLLGQHVFMCSTEPLRPVFDHAAVSVGLLCEQKQQKEVSAIFLKLDNVGPDHFSHHGSLHGKG